MNEIFTSSGSSLALDSSHLVTLPVLSSFSEIGSLVTLPDFTGITNKTVWTVAITLAIVASIETLLCIEASDRMDVYKICWYKYGTESPRNRKSAEWYAGWFTYDICGSQNYR